MERTRVTISRRRLMTGSVAAGGLALAGCGRPGGDGGPAPDPAGPGFPVTVEHAFGTTTVAAPPQRVVTIGYTDHDVVMALGAPVVGARYWYGREDDVVAPWAVSAAQQTGSRPQVLRMLDPEPERIAALRPDLIIGIYSDLDAASYGTISGIAPTVAAPPGFNAYGVPWQDATRFVGRVLGRTTAADQLVAGIDARVQAARVANPHWAGKEVAVATRSADQFSVFASQDARSRFFTSLGFVAPPSFDELAGTRFVATVGLEQVGLLDRDLLVWDALSFTPGGRATIDADPLVALMAATRDGRSVFLEGATESAFGWQTVLSLPAALDGVLPLIEQALPAV